MSDVRRERPDYGVDAPAVMRNLLVIGGALLLLGIFGPRQLQLGAVTIVLRSMFLWSGGALLVQGLLFLLYVKYGKFRHRDFLLGMHQWRGDEQVLDVGCGRGLLLAGAAKRIAAMGGTGRVMGIDVWSNVDMGGNAEAATRHNLELEGISERFGLVSAPAQEMEFADGSFDLVVSNLCLHNIYDRAERRKAVEQIARVLKPGGEALLSDYKLTGVYAEILRGCGLTVERRWGSWLTTFPPLRVVVARKL